MMRAIRKTIAGLEAGSARALAVAALLGAVLISGQIGAVAHAYAHPGGLQTDVTCSHCVAGDAKPPLANTSPASVRPDTGSCFDASIRHTPVTAEPSPAHPARAPPAIV